MGALERVLLSVRSGRNLCLAAYPCRWMSGGMPFLPCEGESGRGLESMFVDG